jgi:hypothetical protein
MLQSILQSFVPNANVTVQSSTENIHTPVPLNRGTTPSGTSNRLMGDESSDSENEGGDNQQEGQDTVRIMQLMK